MSLQWLKEEIDRTKAVHNVFCSSELAKQITENILSDECVVTSTVPGVRKVDFVDFDFKEKHTILKIELRVYGMDGRIERSIFVPNDVFENFADKEKVKAWITQEKTQNGLFGKKKEAKDRTIFNNLLRKYPHWRVTKVIITEREVFDASTPEQIASASLSILLAMTLTNEYKVWAESLLQQQEPVAPKRLAESKKEVKKIEEALSKKDGRLAFKILTARNYREKEKFEVREVITT